MPRIHELLDALYARQPDHDLLLEPDSTTTAAGLHAMSLALTDELAGAGVVAGDRVLLVAENCAAHVAAILACSRLGAWSCGLNARLTASELAAFAQMADARLAC